MLVPPNFHFPPPMQNSHAPQIALTQGQIDIKTWRADSPQLASRCWGGNMELVRLCIFFILWVSVQAGSETELELKLLGLQNFKKSDDSNYGADLSEFAAIQRRKEIFIDLFGGNYRRRPRLVKVRRKARIPRRSYGGGYTAPRRSSYKVPTTNKPSYSPPQL